MVSYQVVDLTYYYPEAQEAALKKINLDIMTGEFVLLLGSSGSGKSTLVRALAGLVPKFYGGSIKGDVYLEGQRLSTWKRKALLSKIGLVNQDPESQLIFSQVEQEFVFGMENLGLSVEQMRKRLWELSTFFSLTDYLNRKTTVLSGGLKQKLVLASVLAVQPEILILDEPTSQLDSLAAEQILTFIRKLNEELGMTIILIEQKPERCYHLADRILIMEKGEIIQNETCGQRLAQWSVKHKKLFLPIIPHLFAKCGFWEIPLSVKAGRQLLSPLLTETAPLFPKESVKKKMVTAEKPLLRIENLSYHYDHGLQVLNNVNLDLFPGDFWVLLGENAAGKTTLLKLIRGLLTPTQGKIYYLEEEIGTRALEKWAAEIGYLSQYPGDYLFQSTVREEFEFSLFNLRKSLGDKVDFYLEKLGLSKFADGYPRDLSVGERQLTAIGTVLVSEPNLILLDEPTRGLDYQAKAVLGKLLWELSAEGKTIFMVTHDLEFAAEYATKIALLSQGKIVSWGEKAAVFKEMLFFTPQLIKLFRNMVSEPPLTFQQGYQLLEGLKNAVHEKNI
ncbi:MAG TPA: ABC transporter ATP-binding protein [Clostridia bacterium]|nr:ABC transporter ATP-binding protein [Clostridia bacterium]